MHKNNSVHQSTIYNSDNGEDFDYQNQEFPAESPRRTEYYNDAFFNRNRETKPYKKKHTKLLDAYNGHPHDHNQIT